MSKQAQSSKTEEKKNFLRYSSGRERRRPGDNVPRHSSRRRRDRQKYISCIRRIAAIDLKEEENEHEEKEQQQSLLHNVRNSGVVQNHLGISRKNNQRTFSFRQPLIK